MRPLHSWWIPIKLTSSPGNTTTTTIAPEVQLSLNKKEGASRPIELLFFFVVQAMLLSSSFRTLSYLLIIHYANINFLLFKNKCLG